jgi:hypothetical protein
VSGTPQKNIKRRMKMINQIIQKSLENENMKEKIAEIAKEVYGQL